MDWDRRVGGRYGNLSNMGRYFIVLDSKNRLVFKKKLKSSRAARGAEKSSSRSSDHDVEALRKEFNNQLDYRTYLIEGESTHEALQKEGIVLSREKAFLTKRELKDHFQFSDKRIKEFLGEPDRVEKLSGGNGSGPKVVHLYSRTRVDEVLASEEFQDRAESVRRGREDQEGQESGPFFELPRRESRERQGYGPRNRQEPEPRGRFGKNPENSSDKGKTSGFSLENLAKNRLRELLGRLRKDWDLNEYKDFFPLAREMKRKHTFFVGPTNSGKSYRGFNELAAYESGVYLSPLRLLALEGQEEIEKRGKLCSLLTGEEVEYKEDSTFIASTIEMANLDRMIDCALVDEVQLILDKNRGWAWSQALVGIPAKHVIMTGSEECIPSLKRLIEDYLKEELEIVPLQRIGQLEIIRKPIGNLSQVEAGSAIIAFSRRGVLALKRALEQGGRKVSVLYGNLSPGVRREEAKRFRAGETEILVATDCIGMGLNLPIKTVIFSETSKFDGKEVRDLSPQEVKQIAGRAGRYGKFECGYVGVASHASPNLVVRHLHAPQPAILEPCVVRPTQTQLEVLSEQIGAPNIKSAISLFSQLSKANSTIVCSDLTEMIGLAEMIEMIPSLAALPFSEKYLFICAPVSPSDTVVESYLQWLGSYSKGNPILLKTEEYRNFIHNPSTSEDHVLNDAENQVKTLTLYHWLARKRSAFFPSMEICEDLRGKINTFIENSLKRRELHRKCPQCGRKLAYHHLHKICDDCYRSARRGPRSEFSRGRRY